MCQHDNFSTKHSYMATCWTFAECIVSRLVLFYVENINVLVWQTWLCWRISTLGLRWFK